MRSRPDQNNKKRIWAIVIKWPDVDTGRFLAITPNLQHVVAGACSCCSSSDGGCPVYCNPTDELLGFCFFKRLRTCQTMCVFGIALRQHLQQAHSLTQKADGEKQGLANRAAINMLPGTAVHRCNWSMLLGMPLITRQSSS